MIAPIHARLENWSVITNATPYTAPEAIKAQLHGNVYGHERFDDGDEVTTSSLTSLSYAKRTALTQNTHYTLGEPDAKFVAWLAENGKRIEDYEFGEEAK
jgi:hypothetical protein